MVFLSNKYKKSFMVRMKYFTHLKIYSQGICFIDGHTYLMTSRKNNLPPT